MQLELISFRYANYNDTDLITELSRLTFRETFAKYNTEENMRIFMDKQFSKKELMKEIEMPTNTFLLAYQDDEPVGYLKLSETQAPPELGDVESLEISRIYVKKKAIGKGVGKVLMIECIEIAKDKDKKMLWLGVWEHNLAAIAFYKKFGFEKFGSHLFMLGDDRQTDLLMKKNI